MSLSGIVISPEEPTGTVIWLHGLGASGDDFAPIVPMLKRTDLRFVLPHAPERRVTINGGFRMRAWYDITSMAPGPGREPPEDVRHSANLLSTLMVSELQRGVPNERIAIFGFSQGGAMALHLALRWPKRLAGVAAMSTYLVIEDSLDDERSEASHGLSAFFAHGTRDPTVGIARGRAAYDRLSPTMDASWQDYPMGHEVCLDEIKDLSAWLDQVLPVV